MTKAELTIEMKKQDILSAIYLSRDEPVVSLKEIASICVKVLSKAEMKAFIMDLRVFSELKR